MASDHQGRGRFMRAPREYFNAPRYGMRRRQDFYEEGDKTAGAQQQQQQQQPRPVLSILTKPKEPPKAEEPIPTTALQASPATARTPTFQTPPSSLLTRPSSSSSLNPRGSPLTITNSQRSEKSQRNTTGLAPPDNTVPPMRAAIRLIGDNMELTDYVEEYLSDTNTNFTVIGAIGPQGTGKSTLLSMLAGNDHQDKYRFYAFRPSSREAVETCRHQSLKISIYVTKARLILLDCQPLFSPSILRIGNQLEIESIELLSFMLQVCHTVILCVDWFIDMDIIRLIRCAEMLRTMPFWSSDSFKFKPNRCINIVVTQQRAKAEDFEPETIKYRSELLRRMFSDSTLKIDGKLNLYSMGHDVHKHNPSDINYIPMADMKPRIRNDLTSINPVIYSHQNEATSQIHSPIVDYEYVLRTLRTNINKLPKDGFTVNNVAITEKKWYVLASKLWKSTLGSQDIAKYSSILSSFS